MVSNLYLKKLINCIANLLTPCDADFLKWERKNSLLRLIGLNISPNNVAIDRDFFFHYGTESNIHISSYAAIGAKANFLAYGKIEVGKFCMFAADVTLVNGSHKVNSFIPYSGDLIIGNGCWIGAGVKIVGPLVIGDNAVVAAGAVVTKDVPSCAIVGGVPAKIIGQRIPDDKVWHFGSTYFNPKTHEIAS